MLNQHILVIVTVALLVHYGYSACAAAVANANGYDGKCCVTSQNNASVVKSGAGVQTCPAVGAAALGDSVAPTDCAANYKKDTTTTPSTCVVCGAGEDAAVSNAATTCTPCVAGKFKAAAGATSCATCTAGKYCSGGTANEVNCPEGKYCPAGAAAPTSCAVSTWAAAGAASSAAGCAAITGAGQTGCHAYKTVAGDSCAVAKDGYYVNAGVASACTDGCKACSNGTTTGCTTTNSGRYIQADNTVGTCDATCGECSLVNGAVKCTNAAAGHQWDAATSLGIACPAGQGAAAYNTASDACSACNATANFCATCTTTTECKTCLAGYVHSAATKTCTAFSGTKHATCDKAAAEGEAGCNTCLATQNREMEEDPASTATPKAKLLQGKCVCKAGFGDKSLLSTPDYVCAACPEGVAKCSWDAQGVLVITECNAGLIKVGTPVTACKAKDATDVVGAFYNSADNTFKACHASCLKCTGALATNCASCPEAPSTWVEPTSAATNYATYIKGTRALINNTCFSDCPSGFIANSARNSCVAGAAAGGAAGAASGIFAIFALVASIFLIF